ncbi:hypothetical protein [Peribacillus asahii]|uniref:hypothetical protein n=1 Tax=Peribacillus asahii TaxID=228899 RepID=UPI00207A4B3D|nr:hypothetical protein [Peribacillus asahii]USK62287.1 hypothetical protein LIT37_24245 [Peribacillus asahii]
MEKVTVTIKTGNAAFEENPNMEIARILRELANNLEADVHPGKLRDLNGNTVGTVEYE